MFTGRNFLSQGESIIIFLYMIEFMLLIRNQIRHISETAPEKHQAFLKACESYINDLKRDGKLIAAQPMIRDGIIISRVGGKFEENPFDEGRDIIVGYYHIKAKDMEEAKSIARANPEFEYSNTARIEVRPIRTKEVSTGFLYPEK
jgi:hypothetical protein